MKTLRAADFATSAFLILMGVVIVIAAQRIPITAVERMDPHLLPNIVGGMLVVGGLGIAFNAWRYQGEPKMLRWPNREGQKRLLITTLALVVYLAAAEPLGFALSTLVYTTFLVWYLGRYKIWFVLLTGVATGAIVQFVFIDLLGLSFPLGVLELFL